MSVRERVPLRELLVALETGSRPKGGVKGIESGVPSLGGEHLDANGGFKLERVRYVPREFAASMRRGRIAVGDVLVVKDGATTGKVALVRDSFPYKDAVVNEHLFLCRCDERVDPSYIFWYLFSAQGQREILSDFRGAAQGGISQRFADLVQIPFRPREEQHQIVAEIEKQFSRLDKAVANLKRVKASISRYQAAVLLEAAGRDGQWGSCTIADFLRERIVNGLSVKESTTPTSVRALRLSAITDSGLNYAEHRFLPVDPASVKDILVEEGDFFVSRGNGSLGLVGRGAVAQPPPFPVIFPDTMMRLRFADADIRRWVATLWPSRLIRRQIEQRVKTTAGIFKIAQPQVASIRVPLPPAPERERIVAEVDRRLSIVREVEAEVDANLKRAQALRQAVLARAFAGATDAVPSAP